MLVAVCDQPLGTSTFSWRKIDLPFSLPISAMRRSHSTASKGEVRPSVKCRWNSRPVRTSTSAGSRGRLQCRLFVQSHLRMCHRRLRAGGLPRAEGTLIFYSRKVGWGARSGLILSRHCSIQFWPWETTSSRLRSKRRVRTKGIEKRKAIPCASPWPLAAYWICATLRRQRWERQQRGVEGSLLDVSMKSRRLR